MRVVDVVGMDANVGLWEMDEECTGRRRMEYPRACRNKRAMQGYLSDWMRDWGLVAHNTKAWNDYHDRWSREASRPGEAATDWTFPVQEEAEHLETNQDVKTETRQEYVFRKLRIRTISILTVEQMLILFPSRVERFRTTRNRKQKM